MKAMANYKFKGIRINEKERERERDREREREDGGRSDEKLF